jgi:hypothetical protein
MKKILILQIAASATLFAAFSGCSGGTNNLPPMTPQAGSVATLSSSCGTSGINSEMCAQNSEMTGDKRSEYQQYCTEHGGYSSLCHFQLKGAESFSVDLPDNADAVNDRGLPILNPNSQSGGLPTGITVYPGDLLTIRMADGHYSTHSSFAHCSNDISVEGNQVVDGEDTLITNSQNGAQAGAYIEFVDASGVRSGFQAVGRTAVRVQVPQSGGQANPMSVLVGYNTSSMSCGDIKISYQIKRCLDTSLNTFDCSKL